VEIEAGSGGGGRVVVGGGGEGEVWLGLDSALMAE